MTYLLLSILSSTLIYVIFKLLGRHNIDTLNALTFNYLTAFTLGVLGHSSSIIFSSVFTKNWFIGSIILGFLFITVFHLMIITTQKNGMSVVSVASKMSVALSIVFVIFYYDEHPGALKIVGIGLALVAVYLVSVKSKTGIGLKKSDLWFPFLVFVGSGIIESGIKFLETAFVAKNEVALFSASIFFTAGSIGIVLIVFRCIQKSTFPTFKDVIGGILLGIPNYFSVYFFIKALRSDLMTSSTVFILNNIAIVLLSTILGIALFNEKLIKKNWIGIALALLSIILVASSIPN